MDIFYISEHQVAQNSLHDFSQTDFLEAAAQDPQKLEDTCRFLWLDATHDEVAANPEGWRDEIERITGIRIYDLHLKDVINLHHPSYFDATQDYELVVFQKLALGAESNASENTTKKIPAALNRLNTIPVSFLLLGTALVTVRGKQSRTIEAARQRLMSHRPKTEGNGHTSRLPSSPEDLMLRLLNAMVDQYLDLRQPLTNQLDRWQHALLDPRKPFNNWIALLDSRIEIRKLDHLCEEQYDALQELRDHIVDTYDGNAEHHSRAKDLLLVRINDVMEHVNRVLNHARRLEASLESSVQIHFAAMAHRTSDIMRWLTVITALFMPLTLITGIFGMNFVKMPMINDVEGFWKVIGGMAALIVVLVIAFIKLRYFGEPERRRYD
ncbi:magnesium transporter CorA family protein [Undibacterium cyanobacteriorum]|uniref:Magnesium transporter CorA family protein n=1 Tax=Undibacterium cyanobacteriorum TaxID=3073561 RepID=A0ABY9RJ25_9BURK|nr:magnesium transporter CorA family protein [Undibacterium sp. 20NA77.5]WMW81232.1 magnesium transporter CorA family protein [Undibacterium sp. 20NA77.5]